MHAQRHSYFVQRGDRWVGNASLDLGNIGLVNAGCLGKLFLRVALFRSGGEDRLTDRDVRRRRQFPDRLTFDGERLERYADFYAAGISSIYINWCQNGQKLSLDDLTDFVYQIAVANRAFQK